MIEPRAGLKRGYYLLNTDGGNSGDPLGRAAIGVLLRTRRLVTVAQISKEIGPATHNVAEYEALIDIALGLTDNAIAERRYLSRRGVQNRLRSLYIKLGANEVAASRLGSPEVLNVRARAVSIALQRGLINSFELAREEQLLKVWLEKQ